MIMRQINLNKNLNCWKNYHQGRIHGLFQAGTCIFLFRGVLVGAQQPPPLEPKILLIQGGGISAHIAPLKDAYDTTGGIRGRGKINWTTGTYTGSPPPISLNHTFYQKFNYFIWKGKTYNYNTKNWKPGTVPLKYAPGLQLSKVLQQYLFH